MKKLIMFASMFLLQANAKAPEMVEEIFVNRPQEATLQRFNASYDLASQIVNIVDDIKNVQIKPYNPNTNFSLKNQNDTDELVNLLTQYKEDHKYLIVKHRLLLNIVEDKKSYLETISDERKHKQISFEIAKTEMEMRLISRQFNALEIYLSNIPLFDQETFYKIFGKEAISQRKKDVILVTKKAGNIAFNMALHSAIMFAIDSL